MILNLATEVEELIMAKVAAGSYPSADEVVREALRLLDEREHSNRTKLESLRRDVQVGLDQMARGELVDGPSAIEAIRNRIRSGV